MEKPDFQIEKVHRFFSADCFNRAWDYIDKPSRTADEDQAMLLLGMASLWHWTQREDVTPTNMSIGYWQVSRICALLRLPDNARMYGQLSLAEAQKQGVQPFYLGYAYEALARTEKLAGGHEEAQQYLNLARETIKEIVDAEEKAMIMKDLATIDEGRS